MAYADRSATGSRMVAGVIVAIIILFTGYAFITGLAVSFIKHQAEKLNTFDVAPPPPPPPPDVPPPPPPPEQKFTPPPVVTPPPIVQTPSPAPPVISQPTAPPRAPSPPAPPAPPAPPPPPPAPPQKSQAAKAKGNPGQYFGTDNYPPAAIRAEAQGRVVAVLSIGSDGRVSACSVTTSSGNSDLDDATCRIAKRSVKFSPAKDQNGNPVTDTFTLPVRWVLPKE